MESILFVDNHEILIYIVTTLYSLTKYIYVSGCRDEGNILKAVFRKVLIFKWVAI